MQGRPVSGIQPHNVRSFVLQSAFDSLLLTQIGTYVRTCSMWESSSRVSVGAFNRDAFFVRALLSAERDRETHSRDKINRLIITSKLNRPMMEIFNKILGRNAKLNHHKNGVPKKTLCG